MKIILKYGAKCRFVFSLPNTTPMAEFQKKVEEVTKVRPKNQKLFGFTQEVTPENLNLPLSQFATRKKRKKLTIRLVGTKDEDAFVDKEDDPNVINDLDWDYDPNEFNPQEDKKCMELLEEYVKKTSINVINNPREGKKLVVLDIDYTIFDCKNMKNSSVPIHYLKRPFLEEFLTNIYPYYDIVFWSHTNWTWVEAKLTELGVLTSPHYKISFILDASSMFKIFNEKRKKKHWVKPLQIIWRKFPKYYSDRNTVHVDDLSRNFVFNSKNGIKVKRYTAKRLNKDRCLKDLEKYLLAIRDVVDVKQFDNLNWKKELDKMG